MVLQIVLTAAAVSIELEQIFNIASHIRRNMRCVLAGAHTGALVVKTNFWKEMFVIVVPCSFHVCHHQKPTTPTSSVIIS